MTAAEVTLDASPSRDDGATLIAGIGKAEQLLRRVRADIGADRSVGVLGPGGSGKSALMAALRREYLVAGLQVVGMNAVRKDQIPAGAVVLIDGAHQLADAALQDLSALVGQPDVQLVVSFRPWPRPAALLSLASQLRRTAPLTVLQQMSRSEVHARATAFLAEPLPAEFVDVLANLTGGQPRIIDEVLASLQHNTAIREVDFQMPAEVVDRLRFLVDELDGAPRALLHAIAAGANVETGVLSALLGIGPVEVRDAVEQLRGGGYLLADGRLIPLIRSAILGSEPVERTRGLQVDLLSIHASLGHDVVPVAKALAGSGIRNLQAASVLITEADAVHDSDPERAAGLYAEGVKAGAELSTVAVRLARIALATGQLDRALKFADPVVAAAFAGKPDTGDLAGAVDVVATVMAHRGQLGRAAELYSWLGAERIGSALPAAALTYLAIGEPEASAALMAGMPARHSPTMITGAISLIFEGIELSLSGSYAAALSALSRATSFIDSAGNTSLPDSPAALTALVAIHVGEFELAETVLRRAVDQEHSGPLFRSRHLLLLGWTAMVRGSSTEARALLNAASPAGSRLEPRDEIFAKAIDVGLARRSGDRELLAKAWNAAREAIVRQPVDLFVLLPLGEFAIAASVLGKTDLLNTHLNQAWRLLGRLRKPAVWAVALQWACAQAHFVTGSRVEMESLVLALDQGTPLNTYSRTLASAAHTLLSLMTGPGDSDVLQRTAADLSGLGLVVESAELLGHQRLSPEPRRSPSSSASITDHAAEASSSKRPAAADEPARVIPGSTLSCREQQIAQLLLLNQTYREIGENLFISSKTVEHHVAKMKQRVGVRRRSELFAELRLMAYER